VKEERLIYNPQTSFPNNEPTDVGLGIKPKSTLDSWYIVDLKRKNRKKMKNNHMQNPLFS